MWGLGRVTGNPEVIEHAWKGGWSQWVDATVRSIPTCIENKG
jgi:hypothetical protein